MKKANSRRPKNPSRTSVREIPEVDFGSAKVRRNPYARRIASMGISVHVKPGRPKKGTETGPTVPRSIRFPEEVWRRLERRARVEGLPLHRALRAAVLAWAEAGERRGHR
jgi:hypothetical protein